MGVNRVKLFMSESIVKLQKAINEWLEKNEAEILDVKEISVVSGHDGYYLGSVFYILHW